MSLFKLLQHHVNFTCEVVDLAGPCAFCPMRASVLKLIQETLQLFSVFFHHQVLQNFLLSFQESAEFFSSFKTPSAA